MSTTLAHNYYVKALDNYPYCLPEFLEAIDYALSYDDENADINWLMGRFQMEQLKKFNLARGYFEAALANDIEHIPTYISFIKWCILTKEVERGQKLIRFAWNIKGIHQPTLLLQEASLAEIMGHYSLAISLLKKAMKMTIYKEDATYFKEERNRIKAKMKMK